MPKEALNISGDDAKAIVGALIEQIKSSPKPLDADTKANLDAGFKSQIDKYHAETHYWITFNHMGDDDKVDTVYLGAAGVSYTIRKGERVLLPQSAINVLKYAVREGMDHGHPLTINGKKYLRKIREPRFSYDIEPQPVSPEDAAAWRMRVEQAAVMAQDLVPLDGGNVAQDLVEVG